MTAFRMFSGFKSFRYRTTIGPFDQFTCIIGPNGCGKSVVGEAVAFALGGNKSMLRAKTLASLINEESLREGDRSAIDQVKEEIKGLGIQTDVVDRFIVTQNRQAVNVQCPAALLKYIEMLIGTDHCEEQIAQIQNEILAGRGEAAKMNEEILRLQDEREALSPHVKKWVKLMADVEIFEKKKRGLLCKQAAHLDRKSSEKEDEVAGLRQVLENIQAKLKSIADKIDALNRSQAEKKITVDNARDHLVKLEQQIDGLEVEQTKREAQITALEENSGSGKKNAAKVAKSIKSSEKKRRAIEKQLENVEADIEKLVKVERDCGKEIERLMGLKGKPSKREAEEIARAESELEGIRSQITELQTRAGSREAKVLKCKRRIDVLQKAVEKHDAETQSHKDHIAETQKSLFSTQQFALSRKFNDQKTVCEPLKTKGRNSESVLFKHR
ncbi:hypothetical protein BSKO_04800 [Bryopsis sp. KO-2023]|nr:hypothetical protein BSKO_04800 [Bryopsis sp. KO-2023]